MRWTTPASIRRCYDRAAWLVILAWSCSGCAATLRDPYPASALAVDSRERPAEALAHYLGQAQADPQVCSPSGPTPRVATFDLEVVEELVDALAGGRALPQPTAACLGLALPHMQPQAQRRASWLIAEAYLDGLEAGTPPHVRTALQELVVRFVGAGEQTAKLQHELEDTLADDSLEPQSVALARELIELLELSQDRYHGKPVTPQTLAALDDARLQVCTLRLASHELRREASAELLRRRARASAYAIVRDDVPAVVERVLATGHNALDLAVHPVSSLWFANRAQRTRVAVRQDLPKRSALLLLKAAKTSRVILPTFPLQSWLWFMAKDVSPAVTLCGPPEALDPSPCVVPDAVTIEASNASIDPAGVLRLRDSLPIHDVVAALRDAPALEIRAKLGAKRAEQALPLQFDPPAPLILRGDGFGDDGPELVVRVRERAGYAVFDVRSQRASWLAVLDPRLPSQFAIVSRGADGHAGLDGSSGSNGSDGSDGSSGSCSFDGRDGEKGGDGGDGGDGGNGGPGGDGGDVRVLVSCTPERCEALMRLARSVVQSRAGDGGRGGRGGSGGDGGDGGRGGSGTRCEVQGAFAANHVRHTASGRDGPDGRDGAGGRDGSRGSDGDDGRVLVEAVRP